MENQKFQMTGVLQRRNPVGTALPLMFDSPHSGNTYPTDFAHDCPRENIRWGEDAFIDELYETAPARGAWLLAAEFPRTYIDPNRGLEDLDPDMIDGSWPGDIRDNPKRDQGIGLVWRNAGAGVAFYQRKLSIEEVQARIDGYWQPYHAQMAEIAGEIQQRWGRRWHINCHSMPSPAFGKTLERDDMPKAEVVLGDREGGTCDGAFVEVVREAFEAEGLDVSVNEKFKGVELVRKFGDPANGCHSLQVELGRALYMDERRIEKNDGFKALHASVTRVIGKVADYVSAEIGA
ncbi:MAG: N-formylglutamate amidohydrolase [Rhodospirillaceae bacterium]|jgi:N-formylglutamate deformylase|nr:N-formylglutamate amidohydrolase [Rhodospirillaceae bacterium]